MVRAVKQTVVVQPGGRVELASDELPAGRQVEVIVLLQPEGPKKRLADLFGSGKGASAQAKACGSGGRCRLE